jgi:hypothetical protein
MKTPCLFLAATGAMLLFSLPSQAHEVPNISHTHAFENTGYGKSRQGHTVNNQLGSITIWSAQPQGGYKAGSSVKFARPEMITQPPGSPVAKTRSQSDPAVDYGKRKQ